MALKGGEMDTEVEEQNEVTEIQDMHRANVETRNCGDNYSEGDTWMKTTSDGRAGGQQQNTTSEYTPLMSESMEDRPVFSWDYDDACWWCKDKDNAKKDKKWTPYVEYGSGPAKRPRWK